MDLVNLGDIYTEMGRSDEALPFLAKALEIARSLGYRLVQAASHAVMGRLSISEGNWDAATRALELAIEIADDIGHSEFSKTARESLALVNLYRGNLAATRDLLDAARKYDVPLKNHGTSAMLGLVALRQGELNTARWAFSAAIDEANQLITLTADRYEALDSKGLSLCGLALCGDPLQIQDAKAAYHAARVVTSDTGIVIAVLRVFDALAQADTVGILAEVRPIAAGMNLGMARRSSKRSRSHAN